MALSPEGRGALSYSIGVVRSELGAACVPPRLTCAAGRVPARPCR